LYSQRDLLFGKNGFQHQEFCVKNRLFGFYNILQFEPVTD
jgi:hypothetical protein